MGGCDDDAVGESGSAAVVVVENSARDGRGWGVTVILIDQDGDFVSGQHLECRGESGIGKGVGVGAEVEGSVGALRLAVADEGFGDGEDVVLVEGGVE